MRKTVYPRENKQHTGFTSPLHRLLPKPPLALLLPKEHTPASMAFLLTMRRLPST